MLNFNPTQFCDPLGDRNIHWPLAPLAESDNTVIMVTARLDASSLFDGVSPGAGNAVTGMVTLLATAYYLSFLNATVDSTYRSFLPSSSDLSHEMLNYKYMIFILII